MVNILITYLRSEQFSSFKISGHTFRLYVSQERKKINLSLNIEALLLFWSVKEITKVKSSVGVLTLGSIHILAQLVANAVDVCGPYFCHYWAAHTDFGMGGTGPPPQ